MPQEKTRFYFDAVRRYREQAAEAHHAGNDQLAASCLIEAARNLLQLAQHAGGPLRDVQIRKARELSALAERLTAAPVGQTTGGQRRAPEADSKPGSATPWILSERSHISFDQIVGLDDLKHRIRRFVAKFRHPQETAKWTGARLGDRLILYGPPGTGKTMFAQAIAHEIQATFFLVKGSNIMDMWVGESQKNVKRLFDAVRSNLPAVVFMDEIDGILSKRGSSSTVRDSVVSEFIQEMEGMVSPNGAILFIGATNLPGSLDNAIVSRFGAMYYVPLPDKAARLELLRREFGKFPYGCDPDVDLVRLADQLEGHSMRAVSVLAAVLSDIGIEQSAGDKPHAITWADIETARKEMPRPLTATELAKYEKISVDH